MSLIDSEARPARTRCYYCSVDIEMPVKIKHAKGDAFAQTFIDSSPLRKHLGSPEHKANLLKHD